MLVRLRRDRFVALLPLAQLGLLGLALRADTALGTLAALAVLLASGLLGWFHALGHARLIADTPTARIASAPQGYGELRGRGGPLEGAPLLSPVNGLPVIWYRLVTERRGADGKWRRESSQESDASFLLEDGSGACAVDPEGAEMLVRRRDVFRRGELRQTQWSLIRGDAIYVLGEFHTLGSLTPGLDGAARMRALLAEWKADRAGLLARFDVDGNGEIDLREWELARAEARRQARREQAEALHTLEAHVVRRPADHRRLFLISDLDPARIARRYRLWAGFHAAVFVAAAAAAAWLHRVGTF